MIAALGLDPEFLGEMFQKWNCIANRVGGPYRKERTIKNLLPSMIFLPAGNSSISKKKSFFRLGTLWIFLRDCLFGNSYYKAQGALACQLIPLFLLNKRNPSKQIAFKLKKWIKLFFYYYYNKFLFKQKYSQDGS